MGDNLWGESQPEHVETRVKFTLYGKSSQLCGEGLIAKRWEDIKSVIHIKLDRQTLFEATEHGVESESLTDEDLEFWLKNFLISERNGELFVCCLQSEYEVLK